MISGGCTPRPLLGYVCMYDRMYVLLTPSTEHLPNHLAPLPFGTLNSTQHLPCWFTKAAATPKIGK